MAKYHSLKQAQEDRARVRNQRRKSQRSGVILLLACFCLPLILSLMGVSIDSGVLYSAKTKLQMSVDGAALAGLRAVSLAQTVSAQQSSVSSIATKWFNANYTNGYLGTSNTVLTTPTLTLPNNAMTVTVTAQTDVPSYFMKYFNKAATTIVATGVASRSAANIVMVLDRSGSMDSTANGSTAPSAVTSGSPCAQMITAAKQFTGMFSPGLDNIGLVSFAESVSIDASPGTNFQSVLGYTNANNATSGTGKLDSIICWGGTNTSTALMIAWNELYKAALPGANNIILLFTDGVPTAATFDLSSVISSSSGCKDSTGKTKALGGNFVTNPPNWVTTESNGVDANSNKTVSLGTNAYWSPFKGTLGAVYASTPSTLYGVSPWFWPTGNTLSNQENKYKSTTEAPGCAFPSSSSHVITSDFSAYPATDIFGLSTTGYQTSTNSLSATNGDAINHNLTDNAAAWARRETTASQVNYYGTSTPMPAITFHVIGLGSNGGVDSTLLARIANSAQTSSGPVGQYFYAPTSSQLTAAFQSMASTVMRLAM